MEYGHCGSCSAPNAPLKCPCQATHYCDKECQRDDKNAHRGGCSYFLRKDIDRLCRQLQMLKAQHNCSACEVAVKEDKLAGLHHVVGDLLRLTLLPSNYPLAEDHLKQGLEISRRMEADYRVFPRSSDEGKNSIGMLNNLGLLYSQWDKKGAALEAYEHARDCLRTTMSAHGSTPWHQQTLADILSAQGDIYNRQYDRQGHGSDKQKCHAEQAQALGEEALAIHRALNAQADRCAVLPDDILNEDNRKERTAEVLLIVCHTYENLEMFDKARSAVQEAMDLSRSCHGNGSENIAICLGRISTICCRQSRAIKTSLDASSSSYSPGTRMRVEGLKNQTQWNGLEGVVLKQAGGSRVCVRLDQDNKDFRLKLENVYLLVATVDERKELFAQLQDLAEEAITSQTESLRIQVKVKGTKHVNTACDYYNLGSAFARTDKPAETRKAVSLLTKACKILRRVAATNSPDLLKYRQALEHAEVVLARFDEAGVLSAMPCWWPPTSRQEDEVEMAELFASLHRADGSGSASISSELMQQELRMHGLFNFTASSSDPVSGRETVALAVAYHSSSYQPCVRVSMCVFVWGRTAAKLMRALLTRTIDPRTQISGCVMDLYFIVLVVIILQCQ